METEPAYFARKWEELALIARGLPQSTSNLAKPGTINELIEAKFRLAAELKAQHARSCWGNTETCWQPAVPLRAGPFTFDYRYQRADLAICDGPLPYGSAERFAGANIAHITYTCSGMAAISAILLAASGRGASFLHRAGCYKETLELASSAAVRLRVADADRAGDRRRLEGEQILWLDAPPGHSLDAFPRIDLVVFDTTCFSRYSGRISRVVAWARRAKTPVILVRSHTKLDSLGIEYGRLGSAMFIGFPEISPARAARLQQFGREVRELVRLLGSAALPAHFCPFSGSLDYRRLSIHRGAALLHNGRSMQQMLVRQLGSAAVRVYPHGLFTALLPVRRWSESDAAIAAEELAVALAERGLPVRHAGSFGFDFIAVEAFIDTLIDRPVMRIAIGDLPSAVCARVGEKIAGWWRLRTA
jgi:hypothetical protein